MRQTVRLLKSALLLTCCTVWSIILYTKCKVFFHFVSVFYSGYLSSLIHPGQISPAVRARPFRFTCNVLTPLYLPELPGPTPNADVRREREDFTGKL